MTKPFLTVGEAARELGVSRVTVRNLIASGQLPGSKRIGRWWRIPREAVEMVKEFGAPLGTSPKGTQEDHV